MTEYTQIIKIFTRDINMGKLYMGSNFKLLATYG